jgi:hypothetical protein
MSVFGLTNTGLSTPAAYTTIQHVRHDQYWETKTHVEQQLEYANLETLQQTRFTRTGTAAKLCDARPALAITCS